MIIAGFQEPIDNHVHGGFEFEFFPVSAVWTAIQYLLLAARCIDELLGGRPLRAQSASWHGGVSATVHTAALVVFSINPLTAAHRTVWANAWDHVAGVFSAAPHILVLLRLNAGAPSHTVFGPGLAQDRPPKN